MPIVSQTAIAMPALRIGSRHTLEFYVAAFGARVHFATPEHGDEVHHAELSLGRSMFMAGTGQEGGVEQMPGGSSIYWVVEDPAEVDAMYEQAVAAGAVPVREPYDADYGGRHFTVRDPDGNLWSFGSYRPEGMPAPS